MTRQELKAITEAYNANMREALTTIYGELNRGQQNKLMRNEKVRELFDRYGVGE